MMLHFVVVSFTFFFVADAKPSQDVWKYPCHKYLEILNDWPDGYRGALELPVLQKMSPLPESMKSRHVVINFDHSINTLDVPEGEHSRRKVSEDSKEYRVFIKFTDQLKRLKVGDVFSLDITVHHQRSMKGDVGIKGLQFGNFICPEPLREPTYPTCDKYVQMIDITQPDGFRAQLMIPVNHSMNGWNLEMGFTKDLLVLDVPQGVRTPAVRNIKHFVIENREYNGFVQKDSTFRLEFMVHFDRNRVQKKLVKVGYIRFGLFECRIPSYNEIFL